MPVVQTHIPDSQLYHDLKAMGRDNFSYDGAKALMEYLEDLSEEMGSDIEYDPIAFCCDFSEYSEDELDALADQYDDAPKGDHEALLEWLRDQTTVIEFAGGIILQEF